MLSIILALGAGSLQPAFASGNFSAHNGKTTRANHGAPRAEDSLRQAAEAGRVTIVRDDWGIAHVYGKTDADAVFGMVYAQCEDDFNRVETNYLNSLGRLAEAEGESRIWQDLRMKLFVDPEDLKLKYVASPEWLKRLMNAWADGLNFYLAKHADVKPRVIQRFEPWMALSFTEGSIGGDIERVDLGQLESFYGHAPIAKLARPDDAGRMSPGPAARAIQMPLPDEPGGSNGMAIAPSNTASHHALLLINPHTSFFFRSELQMVSEEGLQAYGAVTWGQFFIYQGFNERAGWMHTSSGVDAVDEYAETLTGKSQTRRYRYGKGVRPFMEKMISVPYRTPHGVQVRKFKVFYSHHGPIVREDGGKWIAVRLMQEPLKALEQSFLRTKARSYKDYLKTMELQADSSNNTIFADADGDIAYWHGNFIPRRDARFDFTKPVDGSDPATEWNGLLSLNETPHLLNPKSGFLFNVNNSPWAGAGESSLRKADFPPYVEMGGESARGLHAIRVLRGKKDFTAETLMAAAYDSYLPWFDQPLPALLNAWDRLPKDAPERTRLQAQIGLLRSWDRRWGVDSVATSVAVFWGEELRRHLEESAKRAGVPVEEYAGTEAKGADLLAALQTASDTLTADFGSWQIKWGTINRFQRLTGQIVQPFSDAQPSVPVGFTSSYWGSLASFGAHSWPGTKKWYGTYGNSFVAVVEFGVRVRARAVTAGGESGHPDSKHFNDEALRYASGDLREVYFYPDQIKAHTERRYKPGE